jgi:predicted metal-dependent hydrolase
MADPAYEVRRSDRARRARLTVTRDGRAVVVLPRRAPDGMADELVRTHGEWLRRQLDRTQRNRARLASRPPLAGGRTLEVDGVPFRVDARDEPGRRRGTVRAWPPTALGESGWLDVRLAPGDALGALLGSWLRREARRVLTQRVAALAPVVGVPPPTITIRDQRSRWGSASRGGRLSLNWRLILAPPYVLDYVVIHELAHLRIAGHGPRFWAIVRKHAPETADARRWLRHHHDELMTALDDAIDPAPLRPS